MTSPHFRFATGPAWLAWLAAAIGSRQWVVAPRLTQRLRDKGYTIAISQKRYRELEAEWLSLASSTEDNRTPDQVRLDLLAKHGKMGS